MRLGTLAFTLLLTLTSACGDEDGVSSEEQARRAYLGLEVMVGRAMDLGFQGFYAASSANIPAQNATGDEAGTLVVAGKVDQGSSDNKEMDLTLALTDYSDVPLLVYNTQAPLPTLGMSLKKIPDGTMTGTLTGVFTMSGDLEGPVNLNLALASQLEPDPADSSKTRRKPGTITVTGTATSDYGTYAVDLSL